MENQAIRMKILREKYLKNMLNNQSLRAKKYFRIQRERAREREIKFEEQKMKKIRPIIINQFDKLIKQNVVRNKPKTIRDKLKDKIINSISTLSEQKKKKKKKKQKTA